MMKFDQLIRDGRDTDAVRLMARLYYESGKIGHTRMLLLVRVADELDEKDQRITALEGELAEANEKRLAEAGAAWCEAQKEAAHEN